MTAAEIAEVRRVQGLDLAAAKEEMKDVLGRMAWATYYERGRERRRRMEEGEGADEGEESSVAAFSMDSLVLDGRVLAGLHRKASSAAPPSSSPASAASSRSAPRTAVDPCSPEYNPTMLLYCETCAAGCLSDGRCEYRTVGDDKYTATSTENSCKVREESYDEEKCRRARDQCICADESNRGCGSDDGFFSLNLLFKRVVIGPVLVDPVMAVDVREVTESGTSCPTCEECDVLSCNLLPPTAKSACLDLRKSTCSLEPGNCEHPSNAHAGWFESLACNTQMSLATDTAWFGGVPGGQLWVAVSDVYISQIMIGDVRFTHRVEGSEPVGSEQGGEGDS